MSQQVQLKKANPRQTLDDTSRCHGRKYSTKAIRKRIRTACYATVQTANNNLKENNDEMHQKPTRSNKQTICSRTSVNKSKNRSKNERKNQIAKIFIEGKNKK